MRMFFLPLALMGALASAPAQSSSTPDTPPAELPLVDLYTAADAQAVLDARILALKTVITLTPEQQTHWPAVEGAIRRVAEQSTTRREQRSQAAPPSDLVDILERIADAEAVRAQDLQVVATALKPLVTSLTPEQQRRIPAFLGMREYPNGMPQPTAELWLFEEEQ